MNSIDMLLQLPECTRRLGDSNNVQRSTFSSFLKLPDVFLRSVLFQSWRRPSPQTHIDRRLEHSNIRNRSMSHYIVHHNQWSSTVSYVSQIVYWRRKMAISSLKRTFGLMKLKASFQMPRCDILLPGYILLSLISKFFGVLNRIHFIPVDKGLIESQIWKATSSGKSYPYMRRPFQLLCLV